MQGQLSSAQLPRSALALRSLRAVLARLSAAAALAATASSVAVLHAARARALKVYDDESSTATFVVVEQFQL